MRCLFASLLLFALLTLAAPAQAETAARLTVENASLHEISPLLFGQFMERASGGEQGPESFADPATGQLPPRILAMLKEMRIPIIRFPSGTDTDYIDWRDLISHVPGRAPTTAPAQRPITPSRNGRPGITNRFGFDEYFALQKQLGCATVIPLNFRDALTKKKPLAEAAQLAAGCVAYCNAPVGAKLPAGMPNWPAIRAQNGHPAPYGVKYFQIGNEAWLFIPKDLETLGLKDDAAVAWLADCYAAFATQMRAVDPTIEVIMDGFIGHGLAAKVYADPRIVALKPLMTYHCYAPGPTDQINAGPTSRPAELSPQDWWRAWTAMPGCFDDQGQCTGPGPALDIAKRQGYKCVVTEWNWLAFGFERIDPRPEMDHHLAGCLGAAGFIHGLLRNGDSVILATESMLLGNGWTFAAIYANPQKQIDPYFSPQSQATTFYNLYHGKNLLRTTIQNVPTYPQPYKFGWGPLNPAKAVGILDLLATGDDKHIYIHAINRDFAQDQTLVVELQGFPAPAQPAPIIHRYLTGRVEGHPTPNEVRDVVRHESKELPYPAGPTFTVTLPPHSISILEIPR